MAHADVVPVTLRYHFIAGQILTYRLTLRDHARTDQAGKPSDIVTNVVSVDARYIFRHVDAGGNATMSMVFSNAHETNDHNGKITHRTPVASSLFSPSDACIQEADGTQYCAYRGAYGENDIGQVAGEPVAAGSVWSSRIDNTWSLANRQPVLVRNLLLSLGDSPAGRVAEIGSSATIQGPSADTGPGQHYQTTLRGSESGTWRFGVDSGVFLAEKLRQTFVDQGTMTDRHGTHHLKVSADATTTMQLISARTTTPQPFQPAGKTHTYKDARWGYTIAFPASWRSTTNPTGAATPDGNAGIFIEVAPGALTIIGDAATMTRVVRRVGTPQGAVQSGTRIVNGRLFGIADTLLTLKNGTEAQCEVRMAATPSAVYVFISVVGLGPPEWSARPPGLARQFEQVQRSLDSIRFTS